MALKPKKIEFKWEQKVNEDKRIYGMTPVSKSGFYNTKEWQQLREWQMNKYPLCSVCLCKGKYVPAQVVDHIEPLTLENMWEKGLDPENLDSLCEPHHRVKTRRSRTNSKYNFENLKKGLLLQQKFSDYGNNEEE